MQAKKPEKRLEVEVGFPEVPKEIKEMFSAEARAGNYDPNVMKSTNEYIYTDRLPPHLMKYALTGIAGRMAKESKDIS